MSQAKKGDTVSIRYTGRLHDGTVFDTSEERGDPIRFTVGEGEVIQGFDRVVEGMEEGEQRTATVSADEAYGPRRDDLLLTVPRERLPPDLMPKVGDRLQVRTQEGGNVQVSVSVVEDDHVILDANHPLAGHDLTFEIELVEIG